MLAADAKKETAPTLPPPLGIARPVICVSRLDPTLRVVIATLPAARISFPAMRPLLPLTLPLIVLSAFAADSSPTVSIEDYEPKSTLRVPEHKLTRAKFPFIDVHNHQRDVSPAKLDQLIKDMDSLNMRILINSPVNYSENLMPAVKQSGD